MKVDAPSDVQGRIIRCTHRAKLIADTLDAFAHTEVKDPDRDSLTALGLVAEELADELGLIEQAYLGEANKPAFAGGAR